MAFALKLIKLKKIMKDHFLRSIDTFKGLPHRYEIFLKKEKLRLY